ncbi:MAG: haloacid dehalogenase-like hydrolase, partial [Robiginitalea sp.]
MKIKSTVFLLTVIMVAFLGCREQITDISETATEVVAEVAADPLPSWNEGPSKTAIIAFVEEVTTQGSPSFVPEEDRIATFDNDGTLWSEQPMYFQLAFAIDRIKAMAPDHPEWSDVQPFKALLEGDMEGVMKEGEPGLIKLVMASHTGMTGDEFEA